MSRFVRAVFGVACLFGIVISSSNAADAPSGKQRVYFGTYTG